MERRNFLKVLPLAAISPKIIQDGVLSVELPKNAHYVVLVQAGAVDHQDLMRPGILPEGATGGCIIYTHGPPDDVIKFYKLDGQDLQP